MFSFRPIAPAPSSPQDMDHLYAASCNPPRRAKRLRPDDDPHPLHGSPSPPTDAHDDDPYDTPELPPPKRRGRKPGTMSRAAREAQRKINHSLIEKARRTKINDALATLRKLVPADYKRSSDDHHQDESDDDQDQPANRTKQPKPKASGEKEFKLEILVRTVAYLQDLTERAEALERDGCPHCSKPISYGRTDEPAPAPLPPAAAPRAPSTSRLPSISTWLPTLTPSQSPTCDLPVTSPPTRTSATTHQLPTPPTSATFTSSSTVVGVLPALTLPSPRTLLPLSRSLHTLLHPTTPGQTSACASAGTAGGGNAPASPVYTPEDETAASLLLRMSTSSGGASPQTGAGMSTRMRSASSASASTPMSLPMPMRRLSSAVEIHAGEAETGRRDSRSALTPSRLLGLTTRRSEESDFCLALHVGGAHATLVRHDSTVYKYTLLVHGVVVGLFIPL